MPQVSGPQAATVESASTSRSSSRVREGSRSRDLSEGAGEETIAASSASRLSTSQSSDSRVRLGPLTLTLQKVTPYIGYRHVLMAIATLQILFLSLVLSGCTTQGLRSLHLASYKHVSPSSSSLMMNQTVPMFIMDWVEQEQLVATTTVQEVRAGYFSLCITTDRGQHYYGIKSWNTPALRQLSDPLRMVMSAHQFRSRAITPGLIIISMILSLLFFLCLSTFPGWHEETDSNGSVREVKPIPAKWLLWITYTFSVLSCVILYIAVIWQHVGVAASAVSIDGLYYGNVQTNTGSAATALAWTSVGLASISMMGTFLIILATRVLSEMT